MVTMQVFSDVVTLSFLSTFEETFLHINVVLTNCTTEFHSSNKFGNSKTVFSTDPKILVLTLLL